ncbi:peptidylprolyl isomerase [Ferrovibrio sp.]|uniref:peptidylprolyl isomerase n=1 Tax=Ferrovibrio sp. TaxID=1917215 RepID=UPI0035B0D454
MSTFRRLALIACCLLTQIPLLPLQSAPGQAQENALRIVAVVNDDVISARDVIERMRITLATTGMRDSPELRRALRDQSLRALIDERLFMQEAKKRNITVSDEDVNRAIALLERQMNLQPGSFADTFTRQGLDSEVMIGQIRADLTRARLVRARFNVSGGTISDKEVDEAIQRLKSIAGQTEELLAEIVIPVDSPDQEQEAKQTAERVLEQLRGGAPFPALARQVSRGSTASAGGDLGWVRRGTLDEDIEAAASKLDRGQLSEPIRALGGYHIVLLRDRRRIAVTDTNDVKMTLSQIMLGLPQTQTQRDVENVTNLARTVRETIGSCGDIDALAQELKATGSGSLGNVRLGDLPENFRNAVTDLKAGETSQPVVTPRAVHLFTVCDREEAKDGFDREQIRTTLYNQRLVLTAQRYLQDLRRDATIEFR